MRPLKESVSISLDGDVIEELRKLADESARPFSQYINYVLRSHVRAVAKRKAERMSEKSEE